MVYAGIDPGLSGGIAIISEGGVKVMPYSDMSMLRLKDLIGDDEVVCCLEHVHSMGKQGVKSTFNFGVNFGYIKGVLEASKIPYQEVSPQKWKKEFGVTSDKATSIEACRRLFPDVDLRRTERCRKPNDGMAEALLIALYAMRKF